MPTVLTINGFKFSFYSDEGNDMSTSKDKIVNKRATDPLDQLIFEGGLRIQRVWFDRDLDLIKKIDDTYNIETELYEALKQIENKHYNTELKSFGVNTILNIAIVFEGLQPHIQYKINKNS